PLVTSIRHWSTPDYTRIAIDLDQKVKYEAGRVPDPDRIFFDLHDTRLAPELVGKSFDVEDGFLRKIRVAQYHRGMTRIVLEVDDVSDFSAFFLPNPFRLIIDIHGQQPKQTSVARSANIDAAAEEEATDKSVKMKDTAAADAPARKKQPSLKAKIEEGKTAGEDTKGATDGVVAEDRTRVLKSSGKAGPKAANSDEKKDKTELAKLDSEEPKDTVKATTKP